MTYFSRSRSGGTPERRHLRRPLRQTSASPSGSQQVLLVQQPLPGSISGIQKKQEVVGGEGGGAAWMFLYSDVLRAEGDPELSFLLLCVQIPVGVSV